LFAAGGTGGHVYPAIAIAGAVRTIEPAASIAFAGTKERMEWEVVPRAGFELYPITVSGFQRSLTPKNLLFPFRLMRGYAQSRRLVEDFGADVVVGTGGFVSGPVLLAASRKGRRIVIQEQNAYAGMTNRLLARRADQIHVAFEEAMDAFPAGKSVLSGNPTRPELRQADPTEARRFFDVPDDAFVVLVFGGSLGSLALNDAMERDVNDLLLDENRLVIWQTGGRYYERIRARAPAHPRLRLMKYIDRMDLAYAASDMAMCRSGAITCSELMVTGLPAVLVPSPNVAEDHQTKNARSMEKAGAAVLLPEREIQDGLVREVNGLAADPQRRSAMADAARKLARPDAAECIARAVLTLARYKFEEAT